MGTRRRSAGTVGDAVPPPDKYAIGFLPRENGVHSIDLRFNGRHVPGSPFNIRVGEQSQAGDPGLVTAYGPGLEGGLTGDIACEGHGSGGGGGVGGSWWGGGHGQCYSCGRWSWRRGHGDIAVGWWHWGRGRGDVAVGWWHWGHSHVAMGWWQWPWPWSIPRLWEGGGGDTAVPMGWWQWEHGHGSGDVAMVRSQSSGVAAVGPWPYLQGDGKGEMAKPIGW